MAHLLLPLSRKEWWEVFISISTPIDGNGERGNNNNNNIRTWQKEEKNKESEIKTMTWWRQLCLCLFNVILTRFFCFFVLFFNGLSDYKKKYFRRDRQDGDDRCNLWNRCLHRRQRRQYELLCLVYGPCFRILKWLLPLSCWLQTVSDWGLSATTKASNDCWPILPVFFYCCHR